MYHADSKHKKASMALLLSDTEILKERILSKLKRLFNNDKWGNSSRKIAI